MDSSRESLPLRKNCEGYIFQGTSHILAKKTDYGIIFAGGGIDTGETPHQAMIRETFEETGLKIESVKHIHTQEFLYDAQWPKTQKQRQRYAVYKGDEMYFLIGFITSSKSQVSTMEDAWDGTLFLEISFVLNELRQRYAKEPSTYVQTQIRLLEMYSPFKK